MRSEIYQFYGDPRWKRMNDNADMEEKMRVAAEIHGGSAPWGGEATT